MLMQTPPTSDPAFPALADALDPQRAALAFASILPPVNSLHCTVERVRVKRGIKAVIGYRLNGSDDAGSAFDQRVMVSLWPGGNAANLKKMGGKPVAPLFGPATAILDSIGGQAWFFPNDRKVRTIPALMAGLPRRPGGTIDIVHYVPEQGCTVRLSRGDCIYYGKARADDRGRVAARVDAAARANGPPTIRLARIVHHDKARRILWQEGVAGRPLDPEQVRTQPQLWAPRIAVAIGNLHRIVPPANLKTLTGTSIAETVDRRAQRTARIMPELAQNIMRVVEALKASTPANLPSVLSHCDLHPGNLLWDGSTFAVIDLDTAACAPAALDFGSLLASLIHSAIEAKSRNMSIRRMIAAFDGMAPRLHWFIAASLIGERLYRCGTRLKSPSIQVRSNLIDIAQSVMEADCG